MKNNMRDIIDPDIKFSLTENDSEIDGVHILAKVVGQFFVPDGKSRNGRFYPKSLWEKVVGDSKIQAKLESRMMYGTVGHKKPLDDESLGEGEGSHFMTAMYIDDEGRGIGEAYIIGTPRGKILNTMLRAGSKFFVSSRADGTFKGRKDGLPVVNEDTYSFYNFDFVTDPGFLDANPELAESYEKLENLEGLDNNTNYNKNGEEEMNEKLIEHISNENHELKNKIVELTDEVKTSDENMRTIKEENEHVKSEIEKCEGDKKIIETYTTLGTVEEITTKFTTLEETAKNLEEFNTLGESFEEVKTALENAITLSESINEFGTIAEIEEALEEAIKTKEAVDEMGSLEEIKEALSIFSTELETKKAAELLESNKKLAEELGLEVEKVEELLKKYSVEDIKALHGSLKPVVENSEEDENEDLKKKNFEENKEEETNMSESLILGSTRAERIASRLS
jgi:hypothetical protein